VRDWFIAFPLISFPRVREKKESCPDGIDLNQNVLEADRHQILARLRNSSGSLAIFAAIRRASSLLSSLVPCDVQSLF
jgi:hypothetical protein